MGLLSRSRSPTPTSGDSTRARSLDESLPGPSSSAATSPDVERTHTRKPDASDEAAPEEASAQLTEEEKKKRTRTLTTPYQSAVLHSLLAESRFPTTQVREDVGRTIGLSARKVQIWFQNQRQKAKRAAQAQIAASAPQYGPYTHTHAAGSSSSVMTATASALDPGLGGAVAGMMFSSGGFFGGSRSARKPPPLPSLPEHAPVTPSAPSAPRTVGVSGLPTKPGPYRASRPLSRSASRMSTTSTTSSWSQPGSQWTESTSSFGDLVPPRFPDDTDRRSIGSAPGSARSLGRGPAGTSTGASSPATRTSIDLGSLSISQTDSGIELPPLNHHRAGRSVSSLPPPFTLEPAPVWEAPGPANPYAPRTSTSSRHSASSASVGRMSDPREPLPNVRVEAFAPKGARWDPVRAAAAEHIRERSPMDVDGPRPAGNREKRPSPPLPSPNWMDRVS